VNGTSARTAIRVDFIFLQIFSENTLFRGKPNPLAKIKIVSIFAAASGQDS